MKTCSATATREGGWWVVDIEGVGVTQGRNVAEATKMSHALVEDLLEEPVGSFTVEITFEVPTLADEVNEARRATEAAIAAQALAAEGSRRVARKLKAKGLSDSDVAAVLKVSRSRAQQLAKTA